MTGGEAAEYVPGDPRYGLSNEELMEYFRNKPAEWAIYCWDRVGSLDTRKVNLEAQKQYVASFGERVIGYGHLVSNDGTQVLGTTFFMQLDDWATAESFISQEPLNQAGVYEYVDQQRWSNSFQKRATDYPRKGLQQFLCVGSKITDTATLFTAHLNAHERYFAEFADNFIFRGPIRTADGANNVGTALLLELANRTAAEEFWNNEPFAANGGYQNDACIYRWVFGD